MKYLPMTIKHLLLTIKHLPLTIKHSLSTAKHLTLTHRLLKIIEHSTSTFGPHVLWNLDLHHITYSSNTIDYIDAPWCDSSLIYPMCMIKYLQSTWKNFSCTLYSLIFNLKYILHYPSCSLHGHTYSLTLILSPRKIRISSPHKCTPIFICFRRHVAGYHTGQVCEFGQVQRC